MPRTTSSCFTAWTPVTSRTAPESGEGCHCLKHTDGVGTKILIARMAQRYDTVGVDCVAADAQRIPICIGADPVVLLDYLAIDQVDEAVLEDLARGLYQGAKVAGIRHPGGEIAQVRDLLAVQARVWPSNVRFGGYGGRHSQRPNRRVCRCVWRCCHWPAKFRASQQRLLIRCVVSEEAQLDLSMTVPGRRPESRRCSP